MKLNLIRHNFHYLLFLFQIIFQLSKLVSLKISVYVTSMNHYVRLHYLLTIRVFEKFMHRVIIHLF